MKARFLHGAALWTFLFAATLATGCSDDNDYKDVDGQKPSLELASEHVRTLNGYEFKIAGKVADKDGIRSIRLQSPDLYLDKTIDLVALYPETLYEYDLNYGFTIPEETEGDEFTVEVTVTDLGGRTIENKVLITMDGDYTEPTITNTSFSGNFNIALGESMVFKFTAKDNRGLAYLELTIPELNIAERMDVEGDNVTESTFEKEITFPSEGTGAYIMTVRVVDIFDNVTEKESTVLVTRLKDYQNMYLVDFEGTDTHLLTDRDVWGIPMPIERTEILQYRARYYSTGENTPIRFITSKENFDICFGDDKTNPGKMTEIMENIQPIILPEKGYYEITFNLESREYTVTPYTPADAPIAIGSKLNYNGQEYELKMGFVGGWFDGAPGWGGPKNIYELTQDPNNLYRLTTELTYSKEDMFDVNITPYHPDGWWTEPAWRFDGANESFLTGVNNNSKRVPPGKYTFEFDTHLGQSKLLKKNN